jgi:hypothetical protein
MTLQQLYDFADATDHLSRMPLTREQARNLVREIEAQLAKDTPESFDLVGHMQVPSRDNPMAAAAAHHMRRSVL